MEAHSAGYSHKQFSHGYEMAHADMALVSEQLKV